jgi:hypothetical protein
MCPKSILEVFGKSTKNFIKLKNPNKELCPFIEQKCNKLSRLITYPMGVCSVKINSENKNIKTERVITCPQRFKENNNIFNDVKKFIFNDEECFIINEVKQKMIGSFDYIQFTKSDKKEEVKDYAIIEIQSDSTTKTGSLVQNLKDIIDTKKSKENYDFGMNTYNTIKLSFIQMIKKGQFAEENNRNIIWAMQHYVFDNMSKRFSFSDDTMSTFDIEKKIHFFLYDLIEDKEKNFKLTLVSKYSTTNDKLNLAFMKKNNLNESKMLNLLNKKNKLESLKILKV